MIWQGRRKIRVVVSESKSSICGSTLASRNICSFRQMKPSYKDTNWKIVIERRVYFESNVSQKQKRFENYVAKEHAYDILFSINS